MSSRSSVLLKWATSSKGVGAVSPTFPEGMAFGGAEAMLMCGKQDDGLDPLVTVMGGETEGMVAVMGGETEGMVAVMGGETEGGCCAGWRD